jgi:hypothetical protein
MGVAHRTMGHPESVDIECYTASTVTSRRATPARGHQLNEVGRV